MGGDAHYSGRLANYSGKDFGWEHSASGQNDEPVTLSEADYGTSSNQANPLTSYNAGTPTEQGGTTVQTQDTHSLSEGDRYTDVTTDDSTDTTGVGASGGGSRHSIAIAQFDTAPPASPSETNAITGTEDAAGLAAEKSKKDQESARIASSVVSAVTGVLLIGEVVQEVGSAAKNFVEVVVLGSPIGPIALANDPQIVKRVAQTSLESINGVTDIPFDTVNLLFQIAEYVKNNGEFFNPSHTTLADPGLPERTLQKLLIIPEPRIDPASYDWSRDLLVTRGPIEHSLTKIGGSLIITTVIGMAAEAGQAEKAASLGPRMLLNAIEKTEPRAVELVVVEVQPAGGAALEALLLSPVGNEVGTYTTRIRWGILNVEARPAGPGFFGKRNPQLNPRVEAFELKINPNNESFYLPHPEGGFVQFENLVNTTLQDGKLVMNVRSSIYLVDQLPTFARDAVLKEAARQVAAASSSGLRVEWLVSDPGAVSQLTKLFASEKINITVRFLPE